MDAPEEENIAIENSHAFAPKRRSKTRFQWVMYPSEIIRYIVILVIIASSLFLASSGNVLGLPLLVVIIAYTAWELVQRLLAGYFFGKASFSQTLAVKRDDATLILERQDLEEGDVIELSEGDVVPAECRVISAKRLRVDERTVGGEGNAKKEEGDELREGAYILAGSAEAKVIARPAKQKKTLPFPDADRFIRRFFVVGIVFSLAVFFSGAVAGIDPVAAFLAAVSLALLFIPLSSPIALYAGRSISRIAERGLLLSKGSDIERFADISAILADADTFTTGTSTVKGIFVDRKMFTVENGKFLFEDREIKPRMYKDLVLALACGLMANTANLEPRKGDREEIAFLEAAESAELRDTREDYNILEQEPFSKEKQRVMVGYKIGHKAVYYARGSVQSLLKMCSHVLSEGKSKKISADDANSILEIARALEAKGSRVSALAVKRALLGKKGQDRDFLLVGLAAMSSEADGSSAETINELNKAGIKVILATGHEKAFSSTLAKRIGIKAEEEEILAGIMQKSDEELSRKAPYTKIIAEATSQDKARFIQALQGIGHAVLATGSHADDLVFMDNADASVSLPQAPRYLKEQADAEIKGGLNSLFAAIEEAVLFRRFVSSIMEHSMIFALSIAMFLLAFLFFAKAELLSVHIMWLALVGSILLLSTGLGGVRAKLGFVSLDKMQIVDKRKAAIIFVKAVVVAIIPAVAIVFAGIKSTALAFSFPLFVVAIGIIFKNRGLAAIGAVIALVFHVALLQTTGFAMPETTAWLSLIVAAAIVAAAIEIPGFRRKMKAQPLRSRMMRVEAEGWKGSRIEALLKKVKEMGKG